MTWPPPPCGVSYCSSALIADAHSRLVDRAAGLLFQPLADALADISDVEINKLQIFVVAVERNTVGGGGRAGSGGGEGGARGTGKAQRDFLAFGRATLIALASERKARLIWGNRKSFDNLDTQFSAR